MYKYVYYITRYSQVATTIESETPLTTKKQVMAFYQREINESDMARIIKAYNKEGFSDGFDYIRDNIINRDPELGPCKYHEIMGDCQFYEGLVEIKDRVYEVCLGS